MRLIKVVINYIYIDESGDLGKFGSKYFIIAAVVINDSIKLKRIIKRLRERKLKKKIKNLPEIKANNSSRIIREYVLRKLRETDCKIFSIVVNKEKILSYLFEVQNKLYNYLCGILLKKINIGDGKIIIIIDKKHTNTLIKKNFDEYINNKLCDLDKGIKIEIFHTPSYSSNELQVVDFVAWSISRKFNLGDDYYYKFIEDKIINKDEMILWE